VIQGESAAAGRKTVLRQVVKLQPGQRTYRVLIADDVGLGKTIEAALIAMLNVAVTGVLITTFVAP